jgi:hypothetical protein
MATIISSQSQADGATTTSSGTAFTSGLVVECSCVNGVAGLVTPCKVKLQLSIDGTNYVDIDSRWFGLQPSQTYWQTFRLADYTGAQQLKGSDQIQRANAAGTVQWADFKIVFYNNTGAAVTVFAQD